MRQFIKKVLTIAIMGTACFTMFPAEQTIYLKPGSRAPNGYLFTADSSANYTGIWDTARGCGDNKGVIGIKSETTGNYGAWEIDPAPKCEPGKEYTLDAMIWNTKMPTGNFLCAEVYAFTADNQPLLLLHCLYKDLPEQWYRITAKFTVPPNAAKLRVRFDLTTPGEAYFDKIKVEPVSDAAPEKVRDSNAAGSQGNDGGLAGVRNLTVSNGEKAPNGYIFYTEYPDTYIGIWDTTRGWGNNKGVAGIKSNKPGSFGCWEVCPPPKCEPGEYTLDAMIWNTKMPTGSFLCAEVYAFTADNKPLALLHGLYKDLPERWYRMSEKFKVPANAVKLRVRFDLTTPGEAYFDDIHIAPVTVAAPKETVTAAADLTVQIPVSGWKNLSHEVKAGEDARPLIVIDGKNRTGDNLETAQVIKSGNGVEFKLYGESSKIRSITWENPLPAPLLLNGNRYAVFRYQADGIARVNPARPLFELRGYNSAGEKTPLEILNSAQTLNDGKCHILVRKLNTPFTVEKLAAGLVTENDASSMVAETLYLGNDLPSELNPEVKILTAIEPSHFIPISLDSYFNNTLSRIFDLTLSSYGVVIDGMQHFPSGLISVSAAPFKVNTLGKNVVSPFESSSIAEELVECMGVKVPHKYFNPVSRDDKISIPLNAKASEVLLLLTLSAPPEQQRYALPNRPLRLDDIENVMVELVYSSGRRDRAFPYSLADRGSYIPARMLGAYAVAADSSEMLKEIILHNNMFGINFSLAGITLNTGAMLAPELRSYEKPVAAVRHPEPSAQDKYVTYSDSVLTMGNRYYEYNFNLQDGFSLTGILDRNLSDDKTISLSPSSGLAVRLDNTIYTGRCFKVNSVRTSADSATLSLVSLQPASLPLNIELTLTVSDSPALTFNAEAVNTGTIVIEPAICFPALNDLKLGALEKTRMFFPEYRHVDTAAPVSLRAPYGLEFQFQFMDVYNPQLGSGIMFMTRNPELQMEEFIMSKNGNGVSSTVCFPSEYNRLAPGDKRKYPEVCTILHDGDWRQATNLYRQYLASWYKPVKSQDKDFFLNAVDVKGYIPGQNLSATITYTPPVLTPDKSRYRWDDVFKIEEENLGHVPDIIHLFHWFFGNTSKSLQYGSYTSEKAYAEVGGLKLFHETIQELQHRYDRPVSLYTINDCFNYANMPANNPFNQDSAMCAPNGGAIASAEIVYVCPALAAWRDYSVREIVKLQKETGAKIIYVDVFSSFSSRRCYSKNHGHPVPTNPLVTDNNSLRLLREALPADVAIWTEYPFADQTSRYADGSIHYYLLDLSYYFARPYNTSDRGATCSEMPFNLTRYLTPGYRQFLLPCGIEGSRNPTQVDAAFFNGEGFHEVTWRLHESRIREKLVRSYQIRKKYQDCFATKQPEPQVLTEAGGIIANRFPGQHRTLWTVYNTRPDTYSGPVLAVEHHSGDRYYDVWNDRELTPEIKGGKAVINLSLHPQHPGCIVQEMKR